MYDPSVPGFYACFVGHRTRRSARSVLKAPALLGVLRCLVRCAAWCVARLGALRGLVRAEAGPALLVALPWLYYSGAGCGPSWCEVSVVLVGGGLGQCFGMEQQKQSWLPGGVWGVTI